ncbi:MAG TPA: M50 family metallopeptidase [Pyrinomonadaceae bacterium]
MDNYDKFQPKLREDIVFSPPEVRRLKVAHYVNDKYTNQFYRIGDREHFLLSRMDGKNTLDDLAEAYRAHFGRPLVPASWKSLFKLLESRQMLDASADYSRLDRMKEESERKQQQSQRWYYHRFRFVNPDRILGQILARLKFIYSPAFLAAALAMILSVELFVLLNVRAIAGEAWATRWVWGVWPACFILWLLCAVLHETAHGLTCKYFGGRVTDMGVMWRYLWFYPYCKLDHVVMFHNRKHRIYVFMAGTVTNLLVLIPFALLWWWLPTTNLLNIISSRMLILINISSLINLIPFVQMDGYFMLASALGMTDLRRESHGFLKKVLTNQGEWDKEYTIKEKRVYAIYGPLSILITGYLIVVMPLFWYSLLTVHLGLQPLMSLTVLVGLVAAIALLIVLRRRARRRHARRAAAAAAPQADRQLAQAA